MKIYILQKQIAGGAVLESIKKKLWVINFKTIKFDAPKINLVFPFDLIKFCFT